MERTIIISDVHGCLTQLEALLHLVQFQPRRDHLILLGDLIDHGPQSREAIDFAISLVRDGAATAIRGNHDQRLIEIVNGDPEAIAKFFKHGGQATYESYIGPREQRTETEMLRELQERIPAEFPHHLDFIESMPHYLEDESYIYVHAGIHPDYVSDWQNQPLREFLYVKEPFISQPTGLSKPVVFGHTKTIDIHGKPDIWFGADKIGIDGGCAYGHQLNALVVTGDGELRMYSVPA
ncbi:metallophosphoesterase [Paenibacillus curdlanolyticus YK9]|uniref:Metallophosphoesterase n=1 Tax=Paenibacillus curdlanolyticus YK9 TaxID=717606 RepID=E0ICZ9_9BACL|nr:metallophosphoesterase family protein [Paenibacillus curdlanolyticus]EFM09454.1 metallophosphoesterase [Paenibacillus curdlanolyticus YK9]